MDASVRLLGPPAARIDGVWQPFRPTRPNAILAYLACRSGRVRRSEVAALLWPEAEPERAQADLRQALRSLVVSPFGTLLRRDRTSVWVSADSDLAAFRGALGARRWLDAFELYGGPLLEGFELDGADEFGSWLASERIAVAEDWRRSCRTLLHLASGAGRFDEAQHYADLLVRADPFDEQATREAMEVAVAAGDVHGAELRYEALAGLLERELGLRPEPATSTLLAATRGRASAVLGPDARPRPWAVLAPRLVGRRAVLGRSGLVADLVTILRQDDVRLVTLLGPGGVGKSTLAAALVEEVAGAFPDGVFVAALQESVGSDVVARACAHAVGITVSADAPVTTQVVAGLGWRRALVVLDGFEAHHDEVPVVDALVRSATRLRVLVTSRVRLRLSTEITVEVPPLATRSGTEAAPPSPAAELFRRVAARRVPASQLTSIDLEAAERIAEILRGHPLALELAASWVDVLGLDGLEEQLRVSWEPLRSDEFDRAFDMRDLYGGLDDVWQQLDVADRQAWARLAVMPGSLDRLVAAEVAGTGWRGLRRLLDRAVLHHRGERLEMHALLDRYGSDRALATGLVDAAWRAATDAWRSRLNHPLDARSGRRIVLHPDDVEQALGAWSWSLDQGDWEALADMAVGLVGALDQTLRLRDRAQTLAAATARLQAAPPGEARDRALARVLALSSADDPARAERALVVATAIDDDVATAVAHASLALGGTPRTRDGHAEAARLAFERAGDAVGLAGHLRAWGWALARSGRFETGAAVLRDALAAYAALADDDGLAHVHDVLARAAVLRGDVDEALANVGRARALWAARGTLLRDADTYATEAWAAWLAGDRARADACIEAFTLRAGVVDDRKHVSLALKAFFHHRFGPPEEVVAYAEQVLRGPPPSSSVVALMLRVALVAATAHARLGEPDAALEALSQVVNVLQPERAPRFVAHAVLAAAEVAAARGEVDAAARFARHASRHPALEFELLADAEAILRRVAVVAEVAYGDVAATTDPCSLAADPARPTDDPVALAADAAALAEVREQLLAWGARPVVAADPEPRSTPPRTRS